MYVWHAALKVRRYHHRQSSTGSSSPIQHSFARLSTRRCIAGAFLARRSRFRPFFLRRKPRRLITTGRILPIVFRVPSHCRMTNCYEDGWTLLSNVHYFSITRHRIAYGSSSSSSSAATREQIASFFSESEMDYVVAAPPMPPLVEVMARMAILKAWHDDGRLHIFGASSRVLAPASSGTSAGPARVHQKHVFFANKGGRKKYARTYVARTRLFVCHGERSKPLLLL
jgi:hypothetical protein